MYYSAETELYIASNANPLDLERDDGYFMCGEKKKRNQSAALWEVVVHERLINAN